MIWEVFFIKESLCIPYHFIHCKHYSCCIKSLLKINGISVEVRCNNYSIRLCIILYASEHSLARERVDGGKDV